MDQGTLALLIPIIAITMGLSVAIIAVITDYRRKLRQAEQRHVERMAAIEKGLELPPEPVKPMAPRERYLLHGLVWLGAGLAIALAMGPLVGDDVAPLGWVAAAVGAAHLIFYFVEVQKKPPAPRDPMDQDPNRNT